jgi:hypothetical protein
MLDKYLILMAPREWTRTIDRTGNNRLLYQLSYRGTGLYLTDFYYKNQ